LHAAYLARDLGIRQVVVPPHPGLTSAIGLLQTDVRHLYLRSAVGLLSTYPASDSNQIFSELRQAAMDDIVAEELDVAAVRTKPQLDLRYLHQGYHLTVDAPDGELGDDHKPTIKSAFDAQHRRAYGASAPEEDAELVTLRLMAEVSVPQLKLPRIAAGSGRAADARIGRRPLFDLACATFNEADIYERSHLGAGDRLTGPAIIEQYDSTTVVLPGQTLTVDELGNLVIEEQGQ
jgi:N-methylhydantoinase A